MTAIYELRNLSAALIFDLQDSYAKDRGVRGLSPRPIGSVNFRVVGVMVGAVRQDLATPVEVAVLRNPSGFHLFFGREKLPDGRTQDAGLDDGTYVVRVESQFYQWLEREDIVLPEAKTPYLFDLLPGYAYPFPRESSVPGGNGPTLLRGSLRQPSGTGITRATVQVVGQPATYWTNNTGQWVLPLPDNQSTGTETVRVDFPDGSFELVPNVNVVQGRETLLPQTALRGRVATSADVAIANAAVQVSGHPGNSITASDGSWFYYFGLNQPADIVNVTAILPTGVSQTVVNVNVQPRVTIVVPTIRFS